MGYFSQKPAPARYSTCTALPCAEPHCSCWLAAEWHWASRTCFCGLKEGQRFWANKCILARSQNQSCPAGKSTGVSNASPTRYKNLPARIPAKDSTEAAVLLTVTHANTTCCQLCLVIFLFPKQLGHKIFNCCYYSSLDWSRFLILEKYLSHCLLSQHERRVSCGTYCIFSFF